MKLFSQLEGYDMMSKLGDDMGKLEDLIIDSSTWNVDGLVIKGLVKKEKTFVKPQDIELAEEEERIYLSPEVKLNEVSQDKSSIHYLYLSDLMKKKVFTSDDDEMGKIYDIEIAPDLKDWKIWKLLVKVGFKKRRLRIKPQAIIELKEDLKIDMTKDEVEKLSHPMLE